MISELPNSSASHCKKTEGFQNKLKMSLGAICCLLFLLFAVLSLPVYLFRILVIILAKLFRPDLGSILNGLSSYLANDYFYNKKSPRANLVISLYVQGREMSIEELKENIMDNWIHAKNVKTGKLKFAQFRQYPERWLGFTFYKKCMDTFDISNHVYTHNQPNNEMDFFGDEDINNICENLVNNPYKPCTSLWEVHLVKNYISDKMKTCDPTEKSFVLIFKFHHSLADGYSILAALVEGFGEQEFSDIKLPTPRFPKRNIIQKIFYYVLLPFKVLFEFSYIFSHIFQSSPWKIENDKKEWSQFCAKSDSISIQKIKFIKNKLGVSFTSVLLYSISSAIYKTFQNLKVKSLNTSQFESFFEGEFSLNSISCASALPLLGHPGSLTNHTTIALFDLPIGSNDSFISGLRNVDLMLETTKNSALPLCVPLYSALVGCHLYPVGNLFGNQKMFHLG